MSLIASARKSRGGGSGFGSSGFVSGVFGVASTGFGAGGVLGRGADGSAVPDPLGSVGVTGGGGAGGSAAGGRFSRAGWVLDDAGFGSGVLGAG